MTSYKGSPALRVDMYNMLNQAQRGTEIRSQQWIRKIFLVQVQLKKPELYKQNPHSVLMPLGSSRGWSREYVEVRL